jgi:hypothetical protein
MLKASSHVSYYEGDSTTRAVIITRRREEDMQCIVMTTLTSEIIPDSRPDVFMATKIQVVDGNLRHHYTPSKTKRPQTT